MNKILILGSKSDLATNLSSKLSKTKNKIYKLDKKKINFLNSHAKEKLFSFLKKKNPAVIINCIGFFDDNTGDFNKIFKVNIYPAWLLIKYYMEQQNTKIKIVFIGSSSFGQPRKNYMLYSAAKTALNNLYSSAKEFFRNTNVKIYIFNPSAMNTKMRKKFLKLLNLKNTSNKSAKPGKVAQEIIKKVNI